MKQFIYSFLALSLCVSCTKKDQAPQVNQAPPAPEVKNLLMQVLKEGAGKVADEGKIAVVHYTGTFLDGRKFDSSLDRGEPFSFVLGARQVIPGWDIGVKGMKVGEKRKLTIPPDMAYGAQGAGPIPPNTPLLFEVELLDVVDQKAAAQPKKKTAKAEEKPADKPAETTKQ